MSSRRPQKRPNSRQLRTLCADLSPEDGVDPRLLARGGSDSPDRRKTWQLCSQVHDSLRLILGEAADERLHSLEVREVLPAPNDSQLLVLLVPLDPLTDIEREEVSVALHVAAGWLRSEIASAITRKRAPRLVLQLLPTAPITASSAEL
jgi:ribosome-binding factor A